MKDVGFRTFKVAPSGGGMPPLMKWGLIMLGVAILVCIALWIRDQFAEKKKAEKDLKK